MGEIKHQKNLVEKNEILYESLAPICCIYPTPSNRHYKDDYIFSGEGIPIINLHLKGFIHPRWCSRRIPSINSTNTMSSSGRLPQHHPLPQ